MLRMILMGIAFALALCVSLKPQAATVQVALGGNLTFTGVSEPTSVRFELQPNAIMPVTNPLDPLDPTYGAFYQIEVHFSGATPGYLLDWNTNVPHPGGVPLSLAASVLVTPDHPSLFWFGSTSAYRMSRFAPTLYMTYPDSIAPVPLPAAWGLFASALGVGGGWRWWRRRRAQTPPKGHRRRAAEYDNWRASLSDADRYMRDRGLGPYRDKGTTRPWRPAPRPLSARQRSPR